MAQRELEAALRRAGEAEARKIWQSVETEASRLRAETTRTLSLQRQAAAARRQSRMVAVEEATLAAARKQAQNCRLAAENTLELKLKSLATGLLAELAECGGAGLFKALAAELPLYDWRDVRVNPRDEAAARTAFPMAEIFVDPAISAGLEVQSAEARIRIINSLEKRLDHLWAELIPGIFAELRALAGDDEALA